MKKSLLAFAALGAVAGAAQAQSSVTLYGVIDAGVNYTSNAGGSRQYNMTSGVLSGSRWGLRGSEDLGGGLKAIFTLENGFNINDGSFGQGGRMFGRQAFVGLSSDNYGTVTLGRQYDSVVDFVGPLAASDQWGGQVAAHPGDLDNFNNQLRTNNAVKFTSANYSGLTFGAAYSLGGTAGDTTSNQIYSGGIGYANGPFTVGAAYLNARNPSNSELAANFVANAANASGYNGVSPVYSGYASARTYQVIGAGGAYTFGPATVGVTYSNTKFKDIGEGAGTNPFGYGGTATFNSAEVNFKYQLTPAMLLGVAYDYTHGSSVDGLNGPKYHQVNAGADYFLSKRTDVYLLGTWQKALGHDSTGGEAVAAINTLTPSNSNQQAYVRVGIRHKF
ncbi:MAG: porin [Janthinobacterium lividum]